jgi:AcrR family transcriptional regulator
VADSTESRSSRRRERTRARLLVAARALIAERGVDAVRTGEITERADVAAGSFYNHFADKQEIVEAVLTDVSEAQGALVDRLTADIDDPAEVVAYAHRHFVDLAAEDPSFAQLVVRLNASHQLLAATLGPRALRDVQRGIDEGRFRAEDVSLAVHATGGALIGTMQGVLDGTLGPETSVLHAASVLRMLGVDPDEALTVAGRSNER